MPGEAAIIILGCATGAAGDAGADSSSEDSPPPPAAAAPSAAAGPVSPATMPGAKALDPPVGGTPAA